MVAAYMDVLDFREGEECLLFLDVQHFLICTTYSQFSAVDRAFQGHLLLLQTWVLPLVLPVLAIWVKTILNAGIFAPFDGDHNILQIIFIMIAVESLSIGVDAWPQKDKEYVSRDSPRLPLFSHMYIEQAGGGSCTNRRQLVGGLCGLVGG
jgi:hypothetical protein